MPLTYTGRNVKPGNGAHPSLIDIAVGLSRQPRFAGQTRRWWSVLDHTLFGDELMRHRVDTASELRLAWLLHDAHEAITGDVPTDVKKLTELGMIQDGLDYRILEAYYPAWDQNGRWTRDHDEVKAIDKRCLLAEAHVVGPPAAADYFEEPDDTDAAVLRILLETTLWIGAPPYRQGQEKHPAVREYLARMNELM